MTFLLVEDAALKAKLSGMHVTDINSPVGGRPVAVRFRLPENELADLTFPAVIIDHTGISVDHEREMRGYIQMPYAPEGYLWWDADGTANSFDPLLSNYFAEVPIPVSIDYTLTILARRQTHNIALIAELMRQSRLHPRFAYLAIPADGTVRRLEVIGGPESQAIDDENGKRLFRTLYSIRVSSELVPEQIETVARAITVGITLNYQSALYA